MDLRKTLMMIGGVFPVVCANPGLLNEEKNLHRKKNSLEQEISGSISGLSQEKPFIIYDLGLTNTEKEYLSLLKINSCAEYSHFGSTQALCLEVKDFVAGLGNDVETSVRVSELIEKCVKVSLAASGKEAAWVTLRASVPNKEFDSPRWHTDGYFYAPYKGQQYKIAMVLKGPQTLFYSLPNKDRKWFNEVQRSHQLIYHKDGSIDQEGTFKATFKTRKLLADSLDKKNIVSGAFGQGVIFAVGGDDVAAVHSEPPIQEERLFLSIVPGSPLQIQELQQRWKK
jgi:hypothetical protein